MDEVSTIMFRPPMRTLDAPIDVSSDQRPIQSWILPDGSPWAELYRLDEIFYIVFPDYAHFQIAADGMEVLCWQVPDVSSSTVEHLYLNQVIPLALSRQRHMVFHASAVMIGDGVVAFIGPSGSGKSTLAADFASKGFPFLTDDALLLEEQNDQFWVHPTHPSIRLNMDSHRAVVPDFESQLRTLGSREKSRIGSSLELPYCDRVMPLRGCFFLGAGSADHVLFSPMSARDSLIALIKQSFLLDVKEREAMKQQFERLTKLVRQPIHFRFDYPRRYESLPTVRRAILAHIQALEL